MHVSCVCLLAYCLLFFLPAIGSNDTECTEEGEVYEYQEEEDQGQANQGKPSTCCISESYHDTMHYSTLLLLLCIVFLILLIIPR
jgi:hypothetical protein